MPRLGSLPRALLRGLVPAGVLALWVWNVVNTDRTPAADGPHMRSQALHLGGWLAHGVWARAGHEIIRLTAPHPPVGYLPLIVAAIFSRDVRVIIGVSDVFFGLLLLDASMRLCRRDGWLSGQLAWAFGMASAMTWWSGDHAGFDLAAAATCLQAVSWLDASEGLSRRREVVAFSAWLAAAFLTKYSSPLVLVGPVVLGGVLGGAMVRERRNLGIAVAVFLVIAVPYYALNGTAVVTYVRSALDPHAAPGNFPASRTILERFGGDGQLGFIGVLKDQLGWPAMALLLGAAVLRRRWLPLAGVVCGVVILGAMNSREARYALPLVFLLTTAGAPLLRFGWQHLAGFGALAALTLYGTASSFYACDAACAPAARVFEMDVGAWQTRGVWPEPSESFRPISEPVGEWQVAEVVGAAMDAGANGILLVISDRIFCPKASSFMLAAESLGLDLPMHVVHVLETSHGLEVNTYTGLFAEQQSEDPAFGYVILSEESTDAQAWFAAHAGEEIRRFSLPRGATGVLLKW